jgi:hypothetical protein
MKRPVYCTVIRQWELTGISLTYRINLSVGYKELILIVKQTQLYLVALM